MELTANNTTLDSHRTLPTYLPHIRPDLKAIRRRDLRRFSDKNPLYKTAEVLP